MVTGRLPFKERRPRRMLLLMRRGPAFPPGLSPGEPAPGPPNPRGRPGLRLLARPVPRGARRPGPRAVLRQEEGTESDCPAPRHPALPPAVTGELGGWLPGSVRVFHRGRAGLGLSGHPGGGRAAGAAPQPWPPARRVPGPDPRAAPAAAVRAPGPAAGGRAPLDAARPARAPPRGARRGARWGGVRGRAGGLAAPQRPP